MEDIVESSGSESGVNSPSESSTPETPPPAESQSAEGSQEASNQSAATDKQPPFHEHPRFKELVQQKNEFSQKVQASEQRMQQMQAQFNQQIQEMQRSIEANRPQPQKAYDKEKLLQRLQGIDPEFHGLISDVTTQMEALKQLQEQFPQVMQWKQQSEQTNLQQQAESRLSQLYSENKVPKEMQDMYESMIESMVFKNPKSTLKDLDNYFKSTHDRYSKFTTEYDRKIRESYVTNKKQDATPGTQTGGAPVSASKGPKASSLDDVKATIVQRLKQLNQKV